MSIYLIPILAVLTGWLPIRIAIWFLFRNKKRITFSLDEIRPRLTDPEKIKAILPVVEGYMDTFLREKLPEAMPVFKMFIGDSTIQMVKDVLMKELDNMFPIIIDQYLQNLDLEKIINEKIAALDLKKLFRKELMIMQLAAALLSLLTGLLQLVIATAY